MRTARSMTLMLAVVWASSGTLECFAWSPIRPEPHLRHSPNGKYYLDYFPWQRPGWDSEFPLELTRIRRPFGEHRVYSSTDPSVPQWSFSEDQFWPFRDTEEDGCLFVADDGRSVAGPCWYPLGDDAGTRTWDGLLFVRSDGSRTLHRMSELPTWKLWPLDVPAEIVWQANGGSTFRGSNLTRQGDVLWVDMFGLRKVAVSISTGDVVDWCWNPVYAAFLLGFYFCPTAMLIQRRRHRRSSLEQDHMLSEVSIWCTHPVLRNATSVVVGMIGCLFAVGVVLNIFGGAIDRIGATCCTTATAASVLMIPAAVIATAVRWGFEKRVDYLGPWLAFLLAVMIHTLTSPLGMPMFW